MDNFVIS